MPERAYLSIGEVLALLKDEFTDITISKIRFLESQGLIDPERTPSGYRKFYEPDVERLRWILRQQKEHYLPLRVIKGKLSDVQAGDVQAGDVQAGDVQAGEAPAGDDVEDEEGEDVEPSTPPALAAVPDPPEEEAAALEDEPEADAPLAELVVVGTAPEPALEAPETPREPTAPPVPAGTGPRSAPPFPESLRRSARSSPAAFLSSPEPPRHLRSQSEAAPPTPLDGAGPAEPEDGADELDLDETVELTADELGIVAGLPPLVVAELERYGLIKGQPSPGGRYYDAAALEIANLASAFARFGVEPRHLRMWRSAADREADFYEQVVTPLRSQRSNKARRQASETVVELADLGARLHVALVAGTLKRLT